MKKIMGIVIFTAALTMLAGCSSNTRSEDNNTDATVISEETTEVSEEATVTLAAAASLEYAFTEELIPLFEEENPGITVEGTYDSSGKLQTQIESGLDADIFFSAATKQMDALNEEGLVVSDSITELLENKIVLIVPSESENEEIQSFEDITKAEMIALGDPESVPVGQYSEESLTNLGIRNEIQNKVSFGTNVTEVLNWVAESSAECGIVYATDAAISDKVKVLMEAPENTHKPVVYPIAMVNSSKNPDVAKDFIAYLSQDAQKNILAKYGFNVK